MVKNKVDNMFKLNIDLSGVQFGLLVSILNNRKSFMIFGMTIWQQHAEVKI